MKKYCLLFFPILVLFSTNIIAQSGNDLLSGNVSQNQVDSMLIPSSEWHPYSTINGREFWNNLPEKAKADYIKKAEKYSGQEWKMLPASVFLDFARNGNRTRYEGK